MSALGVTDTDVFDGSVHLTTNIQKYGNKAKSIIIKVSDKTIRDSFVQGFRNFSRYSSTDSFWEFLQSFFFFESSP